MYTLSHDLSINITQRCPQIISQKRQYRCGVHRNPTEFFSDLACIQGKRIAVYAIGKEEIDLRISRNQYDKGFGDVAKGFHIYMTFFKSCCHNRA